MEEIGIIFQKRFTFLAGKRGWLQQICHSKRLVVLAPHGSQLSDNERKKKTKKKVKESERVGGWHNVSCLILMVIALLVYLAVKCLFIYTKPDIAKIFNICQ